MRRKFLFAFFVGITSIQGAVLLQSTPAALQTTDLIFWSQFGPDQTSFGQYFTAVTSNNDNSVNGALLNPASATILAAGTDFTANGAGIVANDALLSTDDGTSAGGGLQLKFQTAVFGAGAYLQAAGNGPFQARIQAFAGFSSVLDATVSSDAAGDALFLGLSDTTKEITKIVYSLVSAPAGTPLGDFVVDSLYVQNAFVDLTQAPPPPPPSQIVGNPEPSFLPVIPFALLALGLKLKKRSARN